MFKFLHLNSSEQLILKFTLGCFLFSHAIMVIADMMFEDYDHSTQLLISEDDINRHYFLWSMLKHTARWDAIFFIEISEYGYVVEKNHVFFPLYSRILRFFSEPLANVLQMNIVIAILVINLLVSFVIYCASALMIYRVGSILMNSPGRSVIAALLFAVNPSACHFLAVYTENLYTFLLLLFCYVFYSNFTEPDSFLTKRNVSYAVFIYSSCIVAASGFVRSNSLFLLGIIGLPLLQRFLIFGQQALQSDVPEVRKKNIQIMVHCVVTAVVCVLISFLAQIIVMYAPYYTYCIEQSSDPWYPPWCRNLIPNVYPYLQATFWNVGLLTSFSRAWYEILTGMVPLVFVAYQIIYYLKRNWKHFFTLGLINDNRMEVTGFLNKKLGPFIIYSLILWVIAFFLALIDSANRFFSHTPTYYWFMAEVIYGEKKPVNKNIMLILFLMYGVGVLEFSNFY